MPEHDFCALLLDALRVIEAEVPSLSAALRAALGDRVVSIQVDGPAFNLAVRSGRLERVRGEADVWGGATRDGVDRVLRGECSLEEAVLEGLVELRGHLDDLVALDEALRLFAQAAVRSPAVGPIFERWNEAQGDRSE